MLEFMKSLGQLHSQHLTCTPYLCGWSFRSLKNDRASITGDLRHFSHLYYTPLGKKPPICNPGPSQCEGKSSQNRRRFRSIEAQEARNQSAHNFDCEGSCRRLLWHREPFASVAGGRAIDIVSTGDERLRCCAVTERTLTVSHVWSHGRGGRPDNESPQSSGFNQCLYQRYAKLTTLLGYDSYWMDTPCILSEKDLRWECISQITSVFSTSRKTLICDKDIMDIDISSHAIDVYETILATLLVCDWSLREWTLLDATRGRADLHLLCFKNQVISLKQLLKCVHAEGQIDLTILILSRHYLYLSGEPGEFYDVTDLFEEDSSADDPPLIYNHLDIGEAVALLSHRHATRDGEDPLIWSLLIGDVEDDSPVEMWKRQVGRNITSSAPRVQHEQGLRWVPLPPNVIPPVRGNY